MASSGRPNRSDRPTRQQLDELDALMERMLALPVNQPEGVPVPAVKPPRIPSQAVESTAREASSPVAGAAALTTPELAMPLVDTETEVPPPVQTTVLTWSPPDSAQGAPAPKAVQQRALIADAGPASEPQPDISAARQESHTASLILPRWLRILVWSNALFDSGTRWLGPLGRWLRSPAGRTLVGIAGISLVAGAAAWLLLNTWGWTW
jgi:hypothetical protein